MPATMRTSPAHCVACVNVSHFRVRVCALSKTHNDETMRALLCVYVCTMCIRMKEASTAHASIMYSFETDNTGVYLPWSHRIQGNFSVAI